MRRPIPSRRTPRALARGPVRAANRAPTPILVETKVERLGDRGPLLTIGQPSGGAQPRSVTSCRHRVYDAEVVLDANVMVGRLASRSITSKRLFIFATSHRDGWRFEVMESGQLESVKPL